MNPALKPRAFRMLFWALLVVLQICGGPLLGFSEGARDVSRASARLLREGDAVSAPECSGAGAKIAAGPTSLGASAAAITTWKVHGLNGISGGLQGGLEAVVDDAGGGSGGLVSDVFWNVRPAFWSAMDGLSRVGSYGLLPGTTPDYSEEGHGLAAATFWRGRRSDLTGLVYMGARYYDPGTGRFLSPDPLGHASSASLYDYADGDPVNRLDPDGRVGKGLMSGWSGGIAADAPDSPGFYSARILGGAMSGFAEGMGDRAVGLWGTANSIAAWFNDGVINAGLTVVQSSVFLADQMHHIAGGNFSALGTGSYNAEITDGLEAVRNPFAAQGYYEPGFASQMRDAAWSAGMILLGSGRPASVGGAGSYFRNGKMHGTPMRNAARVTPKLDNAANAVEDFLGGPGKIIKNADGDTILMRGDKKIRFDIKDPHGDKPHFHLEQQTPGGKWKDAEPEHRYYFKEGGQ